MNTDHGSKLSEEVHNMFKELRKTLKLKNMDERTSMKGKFDTRIEETVKRYDQYENFTNRLSTSGTTLVHGSPASYIWEWNRPTILLNMLSGNMW